MKELMLKFDFYIISQKLGINFEKKNHQSIE